MDGYTTSYVNLIADNLRDRYENGFPILKELIQNADDAKARTFIFGRHAGFPNAAHPLLQGPGLWFFNDGEFQTEATHTIFVPSESPARPATTVLSASSASA